MESSVSTKRKPLLSIAIGLLVVTVVCTVTVGLVFGKYYNLSNTFGYRDITGDLIQGLRDNVTDPVPITVTAKPFGDLSYLAMCVNITFPLTFSSE